MSVRRPPGQPTQATLVLPSTRTVAVVAGSTVAILVVLGIAAVAVSLSGLVFHGRNSVIALFSLDNELNVPTAVSVLGLGACAVVLAVLGALQRLDPAGQSRHFTALALIFAYIAVDEGGRIHERLNTLLAPLPITTGIFRWGWVLVFGVLVAVLTVVYLPFLWRLPRRHAAGMALAGAIYVGGALGVEMFGAWASGTHGADSAIYLVSTIVEETMEMAGIALFFTVLWSLLGHWYPTVGVRAGGRRAAPAGPAVAEERVPTSGAR